MQKERLAFIDVAKSLAMIAVVIGTYYKSEEYNFRMALFMASSNVLLYCRIMF